MWRIYAVIISIFFSFVFIGHAELPDGQMFLFMLGALALVIFGAYYLYKNADDAKRTLVNSGKWLAVCLPFYMFSRATNIYFLSFDFLPITFQVWFMGLWDGEPNPHSVFFFFFPVIIYGIYRLFKYVLL